MKKIWAARLGACVLGVIFLAFPASSQEAKEDAPKGPDARREGYRQFFKAPITILDFWEAIDFEVDVGKYEFAAKYLHEMIEKKFPDEDIASLVDKVTLNSIFKLRLVTRWSDDKAIHERAKKEAEEFIHLAGTTSMKSLQDPQRIAKLISQLAGNAQERAFAYKELYRSGVGAVPLLIDEMNRRGAGERAILVDLFRKLGSEVEGPIIAALDGASAEVQADLIDVLVSRGSMQAVNELWFVFGDERRNEAVRKKARQAIATLTNADPSTLPNPRTELVALAEKYYKGKVHFPNPASVNIWRWDGMKVVQGWPELNTVDAKRANAYYCQRYCSQALILDPLNVDAQALQLLNNIQGHMAQTDIRVPLIRSNPALHQLLSVVNPDLLIRVMERALAEKNTPVVLAITRALGDIAEVKAIMPRGSRVPVLVAALNYGDRRVELEAAFSMLRIPGSQKANASAQVVEVLGRALRMEPVSMGKARVLVAVNNLDWRHQVVAAVRNAGMDPVLAANGYETLRRLEKASDIDAIFLDSTLAEPGLHHLLSGIKSESYAARVPIFLAAVPEGNAARDLVDRYGNVMRRLEQIEPLVAQYKKDRKPIEEEFQRDLNNLEVRRQKELKEARKSEDYYNALAKIEKDYAEGVENAEEAFKNALQLLRRNHLGIIKTIQDEEALFKMKAAIGDEYALEGRKRVDSLRRHFQKESNIRVVSSGHLTDPQALGRDIHLVVDEIGAPVLSEEERKAYAENAVYFLARITKGEFPGYDARPATTALISALTPGRLSDQAMIPLIEALGQLSLGRVQPELAAIVMDGKRPAPVRITASGSLTRHIQKNGILMSLEEVTVLERACLQPQGDPSLTLFFSSIVAALRPGPATTGKRLIEFPGPVPGFAPPKPPMEKEAEAKEKALPQAENKNQN